MTDFENICKMLDASEDCTCYSISDGCKVFNGEMIDVKVVFVNDVEFVFHAGLEELLTVRTKPTVKIKYTGRK